MSLEETQRAVAEQKDSVRLVLYQYVETHGHPCDWPQFEYWASKQHGEGIDGIQNDLVLAALTLDCFSKPGPDKGGLNLEERVTCKVCGRAWDHTSVESSMLAYRDRLIPVDERTCVGKYKGREEISASLFTAYFRPHKIKSVIFAKWKRFMFGNMC